MHTHTKTNTTNKYTNTYKLAKVQANHTHFYIFVSAKSLLNSKYYIVVFEIVFHFLQPVSIQSLKRSIEMKIWFIYLLLYPAYKYAYRANSCTLIKRILTIYMLLLLKINGVQKYQKLFFSPNCFILKKYILTCPWW